MKFANTITRVQAWDGFWMKFMALWVVPYQSEESLGLDLADIIKDGVKLDFVPIGEYKPKKVLWNDEVKSKNATSGEQMWSLMMQRHVPLLGVFFALSSALWLMSGTTLVVGEKIAFDPLYK